MRSIAHIIPARAGFAQTTAAMNTGSTIIIAANSSRVYLLIQNISDVDIYINVAGAAAATTTGILIAANGGYYETPGGVTTTTAVYGITSSGSSKTVVVLEG